MSRRSLLPPAIAARRRAAPPGPPSLALGPPRLLRSAGLRFAVLFAAMFACAAVALVAVLWWATAGAVDRQTDAAIRADAVALTERWREAGTTGLIEAIEDRLATDVENESIYLLTNAEGTRRVAGNLDAWPRGWPEASPWFRTRVLHDSLLVEARLHRLELPGLRLLVGRDETERTQLRRLLTEGVVWASGAVVLFAMVGAWLIRHALQARMRPAFVTTAAIAGGDLSSRVPLSGRGDEFDRLAQTMNIMLDRIGTLMEGVRGVSDAIAHDLRTPIARARAKLEDALETSASGESLRAAVEQGIADLDAISRIFQALLRIAEAEAGARRAAFAPLDLVHVLSDAAEIYEAAAEARCQSLTTNLPQRLDLVGDRDLLLQAVANLLDNAIKFTPPGGRVHLSAAATPRGIEVAVADDGPGLSPEDRGHAGERFFRADRARATPGSGLGLSLVRAVAHLHAGEIELEDAVPGRDPPGLRVVIRLQGA
ncbi:sensor histidine kinase [Paracraurococcus lichenis]|uniref:histidine kinase n=1 Tax=Paracraurococcus lichenis TaxID=3064888 RepID=A0ABT9E2B3_9PROT|nr:HAMP domain-containing sensor histidine kinase [Paracraurococcus sp. LOR1-02]MDO9710306.1 HAMP domain-containing sensor histidine kinase [Paracraurococcus sp. LOR1-02]